MNFKLLPPVLFLVHASTAFLGFANTAIGDEKGQSARSLAKPNFVWLISEDNSKHYLKLFDRNGVETPAIAELAKSGLIFERAFSNAPVCSVARTTLLTSCYPGRIGTQYHRRSKRVPLPKGLKPFPEYLRDAGYYTTNRQKTDYNILGGQSAWDESSRRASWKNRKDGQPFFHKQTFTTTHEGSLHFSRQAMEQAKSEDDSAKGFLPPVYPDTETFRYTRARYLHRIQQVDREIGQVIKQLKQDGLFDSTFIFYFGDHGGVLPGSKGYAYESGLHIPLVIHIPTKFAHLVKVKPGSRIPGFVSFIDFGPTLLNLAGIGIPKGVDGKPFLGGGSVPLDQQNRKTTFGYADRFDEKYDFVRTVRNGNFKYIRNFQPFNFDGLQNNYRYKMLAYQEWRQLFQQGKLDDIQSQFFRPRPSEQLFDLENDPFETKNLASHPKYRDTLEHLREKLAEHLKSTNELGFFPESQLVESAFDNPTEFGQKQAKRIGELLELSNLCLKDFERVEKKIQTALKSEDPWKRYWALIVCTSFGKQAEPFAAEARKIAASDSVPLVRVRAAEFLALAFKVDPAPTLRAAIRSNESGVEVSLILNSLVLLRDGTEGFTFNLLRRSDFTESALKDPNVKRRLLYLTEIR